MNEINDRKSAEPSPKTVAGCDLVQSSLDRHKAGHTESDGSEMTADGQSRKEQFFILIATRRLVNRAHG